MLEKPTTIGKRPIKRLAFSINDERLGRKDSNRIRIYTDCHWLKQKENSSNIVVRIGQMMPLCVIDGVWDTYICILYYAIAKALTLNGWIVYPKPIQTKKNLALEFISQVEAIENASTENSLHCDGLA